MTMCFSMGVVRFCGGVRRPALNVPHMKFIQLGCQVLRGNSIKCIHATQFSSNSLYILYDTCYRLANQEGHFFPE